MLADVSGFQWQLPSGSQELPRLTNLEIDHETYRLRRDFVPRSLDANDVLVVQRGGMGIAEELVPRTGVEPVHLAAAHFKCDVSTNFTIEAVQAGGGLDTKTQIKSTR